MKAYTLLLLIVMACITTARAEEPCLRNAWDALNKKDYIAAIHASDECINNFHQKAERDQSALTQKGEPAPPTGVASDADKQRIFSRGVLNDAATAYFIKGKAAEALAKKNSEYLAAARTAYQKAKNLTYARVWDPQGWFWSPSEAAADRLAELK
jgi:hypothetical protein